MPDYGLDQERLSYESDAESLVFNEAMFFMSRGTLRRIHNGYRDAKYKPVFSRDDDKGLQLKPVRSAKNWRANLLYDGFSSFYSLYFVEDRLTVLQEHLAGESALATSGADTPKYVDTLALEILRRTRAATTPEPAYVRARR